ncbi:MAG: hypothetical protein R3B81_16915 [bacterium]
MWSRVARAVDYLVALRSERTGPEYDAPDRAVFRGLMPPSISHEGYSAKPMHSYWDDFFALRGFRDAAWIARELGHVREAARCDSLAAAFARDLAASIELAGKIHDVDYVPGCADLGDFDPTSTTIALSPTGAEDVISEERLRATFDRYWDFFVRRRDGVEPWDAFTPYELRNVGAFVRLGEADRAWEVLTWMMEHRTPPGWRQWPEVVRSDPRRPGFLGDLPHTWCGSDFVRSMLDLFAYVDEDLGALRLGRGVPSAWRDAERTTAVRALPTPWGEISWELSDRGTTLRIEGEARPPGGILVDFPWLREPVVVSSLPTTVHLRASPTQAR